MKRTCSVKTIDHCTFATLDIRDINEIRAKYPKLSDSISKKMLNYADEEMEQRRRFIQNIPIFTAIEDQDIISRIVYLMKQETFT